MPINFSLVRKDGTREHPAAHLGGMDRLYAELTQAVGIPRIDEKTLSEFERRVRLHEELIQPLYFEDGRPAPLPVYIPDEFVAMVSNASKVNKRDFDANVKKEREAQEAARKKKKKKKKEKK